MTEEMMSENAEGSKRLEVKERGDVTVVSFLDKKILDESNIESIGRELLALLEERPQIKLLLDFENVQYLSSAALGKLITLNKRVAEGNGKLVLCSIRPQIYEVFQITKLNKIFDIAEDEATALSRF
jgi:anti-sigma B factor antagonist